MAGTADLKETARIEAFSDGVFAIAITLLVLELRVPLTQPAPLLPELLRLWPDYVAYLVSFVFILIMWVNHHWMFQHIVRSDQALMLLNGLLLLGITVVPFPTRIVALYLSTPNQSVAAAIYSGWFCLIAIFFNLVWLYASRGGRLLSREDAASGLAEVITRRYRLGPAAYFVAFLLAFAWAPASLALNLLLAIFFALPREFKLPARPRRT